MTKTTHTLSNGQEVWLQTFTGEVLDQSKTSTVSVMQGAPMVLSKTLVVQGQVQSQTHTDHELWLRGADGQERPIHMADIGLAARVGHTVTILWGCTEPNDAGHYFASRNHTTGEVRSDVLALQHELRAWRLNVGAGSSFLAWVVGSAGMAALLGPLIPSGGLDTRLAVALGGAVLGAFVGLALWATLGSNLGPERRARALTDEINALAHQRLSSAD